MGARGRAHIAANYTVERMRAATLDLYQMLIEERAGQNLDFIRVALEGWCRQLCEGR